MDNKTYFASLPPDELAKELMGKVDNYLQWCLMSGRIARWRTAFDTYYGQRDQHSSQFITAAGEQGELSFLMSNEYRNLVQHLIVLTTQNKPSFEIATTNTDSSSSEQGITGKQVLDYYWQVGQVAFAILQALEISLVMDHGWVFTEWDVSKGDPVRPDMSGNIVTSGEVVCTMRTPIGCVIDWTLESGLDHDWQMKDQLINKFDLAAQYPEKAEEIIGKDRDRTKDSIYRFGDQGLYTYNVGESPMIRMWTFYHRKTPSMPQGRMYQFLDGKTWLFDGPLPYETLPGRRVCPTEMILSTMGYSNTNDLLGLQDALDAMVSAAITNMTTAGVNNLWGKTNSNLSFERLAEGMNYMESDEKPEVLIMNRLSPEWEMLANWIISRMEAYSGINSVSRGNTEGKDLSGAAMALLQSMAIQFNSGMQRSYNKAIEDVGNDIIQNLQKFANEEKVALVIGENNKYMVKSFKSASLDKIKRVFVKQSNSIQDTTAGKMTLFDNLIKIPNAITRPEQGIQVLTTGRLEPVYEDKQKELLAIKAENEALARGVAVPVVYTENHPMHIDQHRYVILDQDSKKDPKIIQATQQHMNEHLMVWSQTDPLLLQAMGIPPFPAPPMPMGPDGQPMAPPPGGPPQALPPPEEAGGPVQGQPAMPNMPMNPMSGQPFNPETGGLQ